MIVTIEKPQPQRRGLTSVAVLIALIIIAIITAGLLKVAFARRALINAEERRLQAGWLAESGLERASSRLAASSDYTGETWEIPAEDFGGRGSATVLIQVEKPLDQPDRRKVRVQADYPAKSSLRTRQSREIIIPIPLPSR
jgi:type II secretory pathway pseudopilin PulG